MNNDLKNFLEKQSYYKQFIYNYSTRSPDKRGQPIKKVNSRNIPLLSKVLRYLGTISLLVSAAVFLFQRWDEMSHVLRYLSFLGFTGILILAGLSIDYTLKDKKSAQTFFGIITVLIPVHFCVLGGFILSRLPAAWYNSTIFGYLPYFRWVAPTDASALVLTLTAFVVLTPMVYISFRYYSKDKAGTLTAIHMLGNSALLIPVRNETAVGLISLAVLICVGGLDLSLLSSQKSLKNSEGRTARGMLYLSYVALILRTASLYSVTKLFTASLYAAAALVIFFGSKSLFKSRDEAVSFQGLGVIPLAISWWLFSHSIIHSFDIPQVWHLYVICLPYAAMLSIFGALSLSTGDNYRKLAVTIASISFTLNNFYHPTWWVALIALSAGIVIIIYSYYSRYKAGMAIGMINFIIGISYYFFQAIKIAANSPWLSLAVVGIATIVASSLIERNYRKLLAHFSTLKEKAREWK